MEPMHLSDVIEAVRGELVQGSSNIEISGVSIDSRSIKPGDLFFAFPGERVDGHDFLEQVFDQGDVVLIKGSRGMKMEEIVAAIQDGEQGE
jgi:UDP-N-acetylmuramoyl-tripeptide--D-alanyl-D-alanine ligase